MKNAINWFEIPVTNFDRAKKFYENIMGATMEKMDSPGYLMAFFPAQDQGVSGAIIQGEGYIPSDKGALVYLNGGEDLNDVLSKVEKAGGKVILPKKLINEQYGYFAIFHDTEGNKIALHSMK
jgi:hypothetical protein